MFCTFWHLPPTLCRLRSSAAVSWSEADPSATKAVSGTAGRVVSQLIESVIHTTLAQHRSHVYRDQLFIFVDSRQLQHWAALCISGRRLLDTNPRLTMTDAERPEFGLNEIIRNHELFDYIIREETAALRQNRIAEWPSGKLTAHASSSSTRPVTSEAPRWQHLLFRKTGTRQPFMAVRWEIRNR